MRKAELLAPAGSYEVFKGVINAGADAVYLGGNMFGARAYAGNLSNEELLAAIDYAHIHNRRLYLTVNTLVKNQELNRELYDYIEPLYEAGLDAVIVQDYGVMNFITRNFPKLHIHASTQMTVTHKDYVDFLRRYNVTRIVPARELSLGELKTIYDSTGIEIESFIHGALCYCYSGQCFMSSFFGGRSGNRGRCAQPCRLAYSYNGREGSILSLKDLCALEILPQVIESGVYSLKIEGRMKSPEYAAGVTSIYRQYLDRYLANGADGYRVDKGDIDRLLMLFDRGGLTKGYYVMHNDKSMIALNGKTDKSLEEKNDFQELIKHQYIDTDVKEKINFDVTLLKNNNAIIQITDRAGNVAEVSGDKVMQALNRPMEKMDIVKQLNKLGATPYEADSININMDDHIFMPVKALNELRREGIAQLTSLRLEKYRRSAGVRAELGAVEYPNEYKGLSVRVMTRQQAKTVLGYTPARLIVESELIDITDLQYIVTQCHNRGTKVFYGLPRIMREGYFDYIDDNIATISDMGIDGFVIRSMAQSEFLKKRGITLEQLADYNVYAFNNAAAQVLVDNGVSGITAPVELNSKELGHLSLPDSEIIGYGRLPLMVAANCVIKTCDTCRKDNREFLFIGDRKEDNIPVLPCCRYCYNLIYNSLPIMLLDKSRELMKNCSYIGISFSCENEADTRQIMELATNAVQGRACELESGYRYTRGHYTRGVE